MMSCSGTRPDTHPFGGWSTLEVDLVHTWSSGLGLNRSNHTWSNPPLPLRGGEDHWTRLVDQVVWFQMRSEGVGWSTRGRGRVGNSYVEMPLAEFLQCETLAPIWGRLTLKLPDGVLAVVAHIPPGDGDGANC